MPVHSYLHITFSVPEGSSVYMRCALTEGDEVESQGLSRTDGRPLRVTADGDQLLHNGVLVTALRVEHVVPSSGDAMELK